MTNNGKLTDGSALNLIDQVDDRTGASVRMYRDVDAASIEWAEHFRVRTIDRPATVGDIVIIEPQGRALFDVVALDDVYGEFIYVRRHATEQLAQWVSLTYVKVVDDEGPDAWS